MNLPKKREPVIDEARAREYVKMYHEGTLGTIFSKLSEKERSCVLYDMGFYDEEFFAQYFATEWVSDEGRILNSPDFHREGWRAIDEGDDLLILVARDHGKTTGYSRIKMTHTLLYYKCSIIIVAEKGLGEKIIGSIRLMLEGNEEVREVFGEVVPIDNRTNDKTSKWRQRELQLSTGSEVKSLTRGQPVRGNRPNIILIDDPQGERDVRNPNIALEFWDWVWTALYNMLEDGGQMIVLGTIFDEMCFVKLLETEAQEREFKVIKQCAIVGHSEGNLWDGEPLWAEKWSMEALKKRFKKIKESAFMQEYQHIPMKSSTNRIFKDCAKLVQMQQIETLKWYSDNVQNFEADVHIFNELGVNDQLFVGLDFMDGGQDWNTLVARDQNLRLIAQVETRIPQEMMCHVLSFLLEKLAPSDAMIIPEVNMGQTFMMMARDHEWWVDIYRRKTTDQVTKKTTKKVGFRMTYTEKRLCVDLYDRILKESGLEVSDGISKQIDTFVKDGKGGMNAKAPHHDDLLVADLLSIRGHSEGISRQGSVMGL